MHPLGPFAEIDRPNVAQIMATLQVRGRARWYPAGKSGDNRRMALLVGGLAPFIVVHLVPTRPSLRVGLVLIVLGYATSRGCGAAIRSCGSRRRGSSTSSSWAPSASGAAKKPETGDQCPSWDFSSSRTVLPFREGAGRAIYDAPSKSSRAAGDAGRA